MAGPKVGWQVGATLPNPCRRRGQRGHQALLPWVTGQPSPAQSNCAQRRLSVCPVLTSVPPTLPPTPTQDTLSAPRRKSEAPQQAGSSRPLDPVPIATQSPGLFSVLLPKSWGRLAQELGLAGPASGCWAWSLSSLTCFWGCQVSGRGNMQACALQRRGRRKAGPSGVS